MRNLAENFSKKFPLKWFARLHKTTCPINKDYNLFFENIFAAPVVHHAVHAVHASPVVHAVHAPVVHAAHPVYVH